MSSLDMLEAVLMRVVLELAGGVIFLVVTFSLIVVYCSALGVPFYG